ILGHDLRLFLQARREKNRRPCRAGEIYCVRCRSPKRPAGDMAEYQPVTDTLGNLTGICPDCYCLINQRASLTTLAQFQGKLEVTFPQALQRIAENDQPCVNSDLKEEVRTCQHTTPTTNESSASTSGI